MKFCQKKRKAVSGFLPDRLLVIGFWDFRMKRLTHTASALYTSCGVPLLPSVN